MQSQVSYKKGAERDERDRRRGHVTTLEGCNHKPRNQKPKKSKQERSCSQAPEREHSPANAGLQASRTNRINLCCFRPQACAKLSQLLQETSHGVPHATPRGTGSI